MDRIYLVIDRFVISDEQARFLKEERMSYFDTIAAAFPMLG